MKKQPRKMRVYVVSTSGYKQQFKETRLAIFNIIRDLGMEPAGYELNNFASIPGVSLSQNCKLNMRSADMFLILINERYGYSVPGENKSITHLEIEEVQKSKKPFIIFMQDDLIDVIDCGESSNHCSNFFDEEPECRKKQIELIQSVSSYCLCQYPKDDQNETLKIVREKIISLAPFFIKLFVDKQSEYVQELSRNTLYNTHTENVPLLYKIRGEYKSKNLTDTCVDLLKRTSVFIEGECGSGKSFCLRETFIWLASYYSEHLSWSNEKIPVFLQFISYKKKRFHPKQYILKLHETFMHYQAPPFIVDRILDQGILVIGDAIDEWPYANNQPELCAMIASLNNSFMISARRSTYHRIAVNIASNSCTVISICGWVADNLYQYAKSCWGSLDRIDHLKAILNACETKLISEPRKTITYYPPLIASIAIQCLAKDELTTDQIANVGKLFRESTTSCIEREIEKRGLTNSEELVEKGRQFFSNVCLFVFLATSLHKSPNLLQDLYDYLDSISYHVSDFDKNVLLPIFFTVRDQYFYPQHMMIVYYYVAEKAIISLQTGDYSLFENYSIPSETNRMIGDFYSDISASELENIFNGLCNHLKSVKDEASKLLLFYFIPRLAIGAKRLKHEIMDYLRISSINETGFARLAILNWLTQLGDIAAENEYYSFIREDSTFSQYNRGSYLIYQQDRPNRVHGFADDDGDMEWQATALSFIEHFKSKDIRHKFIRRPDFATMISFIRSGKKIYPFFREYFENLSDAELIECSFDQQYTMLLQKNNINLENRKNELIALLNELRDEIKNNAP